MYANYLRLSLIVFSLRIQVAFLNCISYMLYGSLNGDPFVMASVTLGLPINYFALSSAFGILGKSGKVADNTTSWRLDCVVLGGIAAWIVVAFVIGAILPHVVADEQKANVATSIVGFTACATCMIYYISPLTVLMEIVREKDAAGLYLPMIIMNLITSISWSAYGFIYIGDVVVYGPNLFAVLLSTAQLTLKCVYPSVDSSKLQRKLTVVEMANEFDQGDEEAKESYEEIPRGPCQHLRGRAGTLVQEVVCGDGIVGVIAFEEEEVVARNHRSNTLTSIAEIVLDSIDFVGPARHPADVVEVHVTPVEPTATATTATPLHAHHAHHPSLPTALNGVRSPNSGGVLSPRARRSVSFSADALAASPVASVRPTVSAFSHNTRSRSGSLSPSQLAQAQTRAQDQMLDPSQGQPHQSLQARRRAQTCSSAMPQIMEEGTLTIRIDQVDHEAAESYTYGGAHSSPRMDTTMLQSERSSVDMANMRRITDPHAPFLPQGSPSSTSTSTERSNAGSAMLHTLAEAVQGRSRGNSRATPPMYVPQDGAVDSLDNVPL